MDAREPEFGPLLTMLSRLERSGHESDVQSLRARIRAALRELSLDDVRKEIASVRRAAEALGHEA